MENEQIMNEAYPFGKIEGKGASEIALKSVSINGEVHGLLFTFSICQEYKNESSDTLEIIYTFPVGWDVTMLGMKAMIGEKELVGVVVEKSDAEKRYEKAVSSGDSAIMVQKSSKGLYTANLGNIKLVLQLQISENGILQKQKPLLQSEKWSFFIGICHFK